MSARELFDIWAPPGPAFRWSRWARPPLFDLGGVPDRDIWPAEPGELVDVAWAPPADGRTAVLVDLPAARSVDLGVALALIGYRPVPVLLSCPPPHGVTAVVDTRDAVIALVRGGRTLEALSLPSNAPPAFLLDASRCPAGARGLPRMYDNRAVLLAQDLPSASHLTGAGVTQVVWVHVGTAPDDALHALRRWQEGGVRVLVARPGGGEPQPADVPRPSGFRSLFAALKLFSFRRESAGAFGGMVPDPPEPSSGGGYRGGFG